MKKLTGLLIILVALVFFGYFGMGFFTEKTIKRDIELINQSNGLSAEIEQYSRGWFVSTARIKWLLHVPARVTQDANGQMQTIAAQDLQMEMPIVIHHGPFMYVNNHLHFGMGYGESVIAYPEKYTQQFDGLFSKDSVKPQLGLSIFVNYLTRSTVRLDVPKFKLIAKDGHGQLDWMGMQASSSMSSTMDKVKGNVVIDGISINKDDTKIILGKVSSEYDLHQTSNGLYLGDANFSLPSFAVLVKEQKIFEIANFTLSSVSDIEKNLFSTHCNVSLKSIFADGQNYGPGDLEVSLRNLDAEVLAKINEQATAMQNGPDAQRQQAMLAMLPQLPKLFSKGAEFEISKLSMKIPQGMVEGQLLVSLPKSNGANPFELIQKIQGNAKLKVPTELVKLLMHQSVLQQIAKQPELQQALVKELQGNPQATPEQLAAMQTDKQIRALEQTGLITVQGSDYLIEVSLDQGKFTINGKPFDPATFKF